MKHLKTLGLTALAVVALSALVGVSSAAAAEFHATGGTTLTGEQSTAHVFELTGQKTTCNIANFMGTAAASGTSTTQSMHPEYSGCTAFGLPATINTAGCEYNFNANGSTVNMTNCTNGGVEIDSSNAFSHCHVTVPNQTGINNQSFSNMGNTGEGNATMTETSAATNITATVNIDNNLCPLTLGTHTTSTYNGTTGIMGAAGGTHIN